VSRKTPPASSPRERVPITLDLGDGTARAVVLSCDLGHDYVSINADYRSSTSGRRVGRSMMSQCRHVGVTKARLPLGKVCF